MIALDRSSPISCGRFARLRGDDAVVRDGLRKIVGEVLPVREFVVARFRVESREAPPVDDEVTGVEAAVLGENAAAREEAIGVVAGSAGTHDDLSHVFEMAGMGEPIGLERRGRGIQFVEEERIDEPRRRV